MKHRKALLLSEEELLVTKEKDKVHKVSKRASETREQTLHKAKTELNTSSLHQGFCTSVLFIFPVKLLYMPCTKEFRFLGLSK